MVAGPDARSLRLESLRSARLDQAQRQELLSGETECTVCFVDDSGWPGGVVMNYVHDDGRFWLTAVEGRSQVVAIERDPRVTVVVSRRRPRAMVAFRGRARVHRDPVIIQPWLDTFSRAWRYSHQDEFRTLLDTPNRVVIEVCDLVVAVSHDHRKLGDPTSAPAEVGRDPNE